MTHTVSFSRRKNGDSKVIFKVSKVPFKGNIRKIQRRECGS